MPTLEDALDLAAHGYPIVRLAQNSKAPPKGAHGYKEATTDADEIRRTWRSGYNIGIACISHVVLDIDPKNGGDDSFRQLVAKCGKELFDDIPSVRTPSGGKHFYFAQRVSAEGPIPRRTPVRPGIDILGPGGHAVAPPSTVDAGAYSWLRKDGTLRTFPDALASALGIGERSGNARHLRVASSTASTGPSTLATNSLWAEGSRNDALASLAGHLRQRGYCETDMRLFLNRVNRSACSPPLMQREVDSISQSIRRYPAGLDPFRLILACIDRDCESNTLRLLCEILRSADPAGYWAPNRTQLIAQTRLSQSSLYRAREQLVSLGFLTVEKRGKALSSCYHVHAAP